MPNPILLAATTAAPVAPGLPVPPPPVQAPAAGLPAAGIPAAGVPSGAHPLGSLNPAQIQLQQVPQFLGPKTPLAAHVPWLTHAFAGLFVAAAILLVIMLAVQTTRQEGLSGTLGGRVDSSYRGRLGFEGQIARFTAIIAITYVVVATLVSISGI